MELHKKHHFVPQFYLKYWSKDEKTIMVNRLLVSNKRIPKWQEKPIKGIAYYENLYMGNIDNSLSDKFEIWFDREVENPAKIVFDKINKGVKLNVGDHETITKFIVAQYIRTPIFFKKGIPRWEEIIKDTLNNFDFSKTVSNKDKQVNGETKLRGRYIPLFINKKIKEDSDSVLLNIETSVGKGYWLFAIEHVIEETLPKLPKYKWSVLQAPIGFQWPTSDNPVIMLNFYNDNTYDFKGGWGRNGTEIYMPITPNHILMTHIGEKRPSYINVSLELAIIYRRFIIENAYEFIYAKRKIIGIERIRKRIEDSEVYKRNTKEFVDFLRNQLEVERSITNRKK